VTYVACRKLKLEGGREVEVGERVPEAAKWRESVLKAHLNLKWLKRVEDLAPSPAAAPVQVQTSVDSRNQKKKRR
jgi:hypothetical protein